MLRSTLDYLDNLDTRFDDKPAFLGGEPSAASSEDSESPEGSRLTFRDLKNVSFRIGSFLARKGLFRAPIAILMEKSPEEAAAFFGVWRAGCYYIPLDPEMPKARIQKILENMKPALILYGNGLKALAEEVAPDLELASYEESRTGKPDLLLLKKAYGRILDVDLAYVVFTSGSTGIPKGVAACHRSVIDYIEALCSSLEFTENTVFASQTPFYFDACLKELISSIKLGASAYLVPKSLFTQPVKLVEYLNENQVNTLCWVVSALTFISSLGTFQRVRPETLRTVAFGSEVFPQKQFRLWREACPDAVFYNLYGPTEATGMSCFYKLERELKENEPIPIGRPFPNTEVLLINEKGALAGEGEEGEIYLRGTCVTLGYYNDPEKTSAFFVQNPLQSAYPEIVYRTGDAGKYNEYGELVFLSRKDRQIKHMGHRIELGEIEAAGSEIEGVQECAAVYDEKKGKILFFYAGSAETGEVVQALKDQLPRYMIPNRVKALESLPHSPNGKINRKELNSNG